MIVLSHPVGNANVRNALSAISRAGLLQCFSTTLFWDPLWKINRALPGPIVEELNRRAYPQVPNKTIAVTPFREAARLLSAAANWRFLSESRRAPLSGNRVYKDVDTHTAHLVQSLRPSAAYAYEGVALRTFRAARELGIKCLYELPSGYWYYEAELLREEAERRPEYAGTIAKLQDPPEEVADKDEELQCADHIFVPSEHVKKTLSRLPLPPEKIHVIPYGANTPPPHTPRPRCDTKLRVIFVGALTQRKGIGYLLDAVRTLQPGVSLTLIGKKVGHCKKIDEAVVDHTWYPTLPNPRVLETMARHDVLVLPSITEGFGLVITEALSSGLPVITTPNSAGPELITHGEDGFIVPIQSSEAIAAYLEQLVHNRQLLEEMSRLATAKARQVNWQKYQQRLVSRLTGILHDA